jgi:hypothetical protein
MTERSVIKGERKKDLLDFYHVTVHISSFGVLENSDIGA